MKNKIKTLVSIDYNFSYSENESNILDNLATEEIEEELLQKFSIDEIWNEVIKEDLINQKILVLYYKEDLKIKEISHFLNLNESSVKTKLFRSIKKLKERLNSILKGDSNE